MPRAATAFVEFDGDFSKIGRDAGTQSKRMESTFNSSFKRIATFATGALAAVGVGKILKDSFKEAEDAVRVGKLTAAVLKSTGSAANVSAPQVEKLANSLSSVAGVDDEIIQASENVLLTFTKVRNEVGKGNDIFTQGAKAALDLSSALGTDLQGATIQVGKALNDPIKGITALRRVGVSFTAQQIDQVKALVASGHALEAQKLILRELNTEFGGAAAANATASAKIGVAFKNIEESLGGLILPLFEKLASFITVTAAPAIERFVSAIKPLGGAVKAAFAIGFGQNNISGIKGWLAVFSKLGAVVRGFVDFFKGDVVHAGIDFGRAFGMKDQSRTITTMIKVLAEVRKAMVAVVDFVAQHWKPILVGAAAALFLLVSPVVAVVAGLAFLYLRFKVVRDIVRDVVGAIEVAGQALRAVIDGIVGFFESHAKNFEAFGKQFEGIGKSFVGVWNAIVPLVTAALTIVVAVIAAVVIVVIALWDRFGNTILDKARIAFNAIAEVVRGALQVVQGIIEIVTGIITLKWGKVWQGLKDVFGGAWAGLAGIVKLSLAQVSAVIAIGVSAIAGVWNAAWGGFTDVVAGIWGGIERTIGSAVNTVIDIINGLISAWNRLPFHKDIQKLSHVQWAEPSVARHTSGKVRAFHEGGEVPNVPGGEVLAVLKSGETVLTHLQRAKVAAALGAGATRAPITVETHIGTINGVDEWERLLDKRDRELVSLLAVGHRG